MKRRLTDLGLKKAYSKVWKIKQQLESTGLFVEIGFLEIGKTDPFLVVRRKRKSKNSLFELMFSKAGKLTHIVAGKSNDNATWIKTCANK